MTEPLTDSVLLQRAGRGDSIAFSELVNRHYRRAVRVAFGLLGRLGPAEDVVQEAFARVYESLHKMGSAQSFYIALYRAVVVLAADLGRGYAGAPREEHSAIIPAWLLGVLEKLPLMQRAALLLRELEGFNYDALATTLRLRRGAIMRTLSMAREAMIQAQPDAAPNGKKVAP